MIQFDYTYIQTQFIPKNKKHSIKFRHYFNIMHLNIYWNLGTYQTRPKLHLWHTTWIFNLLLVSPGGSDGKESACNSRDPGLIPGSGSSPGEGNDNPFQ